MTRLSSARNPFHCRRADLGDAMMDRFEESGNYVRVRTIFMRGV